ncbi:MAG: MFS transporter [Rhodospirillaceae bacterium]|nr:MFS transporter [Rhodospirillaceae bacterium]
MSKAAEREAYSWRLQRPIYGTAFFTGNLFPISHVIVPLWAAIELDASLLMVGIIIASRQLLPVTMSIHGGALLDRFGPRRVIMVLGVLGACSTAMVPFFPFIWATILFQIIIGFCETTNWIGVQSAVGTLMKGNAVYAGRMTASARVGGFFGPVLVGVAYEAGGPIGGFVCFGAWALCGAIGAMFLPRHEGGAKDQVASRSLSANAAPAVATEQERTDVLPSLSDYREAFRLLLIPAIALVIAATFMRQTGSGMQASFYGIWLKDLGYTATSIGLLIGIGNGVSALAALCIGPLTRRIADYWLLILAVGAAIIGVAATPLFETWVFLALAICVRGAGQGLNLPLMMSIASRSVAPRLQGRAAALRISFNRFGGMLFPVIMGALAEVIGLEYAFYAIGGIGIFLICGLSIWILRTRDQFGS